MSWDVIFFGGLALLVALLMGMRLGLRVAMRQLEEEAFEAEARCAQVRAEAQAVVRQACAAADEIVLQERAKAEARVRQALAILEEAKKLNGAVLDHFCTELVEPKLKGGAAWRLN